MWKQELLENYVRDVKESKENAKKSGLNDLQIDELVTQSFDELKNRKANGSILIQLFYKHGLKISVLLPLVFSLCVYILLNVHTPTSSIVLRNVQGFTYPALKCVRTLSVPIIKMFPALTDLYDESCLVENPYYYQHDMNCWPCKNIHSVMDLTELKDINPYARAFEGVPFIIKTKHPEVTYKDIQDLFENNFLELYSDSRRVSMDNLDVSLIEEFFKLSERNLSSNMYFHWRINKMNAARTIRKLFLKPHFLPERSGQAVERYLNIDAPKAPPYQLPKTECGYVFMIQGSGQRKIVLRPTIECQEQCKPLSVLMRPSFVLVYSWWHWKPFSLPVGEGSGLSISYINSFC